MDIDKFHKLKEDPHLSGAYICSLVKQLTSSRTKDLINPNDPNSTKNKLGGDFTPIGLISGAL